MATKGNLITSSYKKTKTTGGSSKSKVGDIADVNQSTSGSSLDADLDLLKEFDLNWEYGPSMGITRMERWLRAEKHGLKPLVKVKEILEAHPGEEVYIQCVWNDYKNIM